MKPGVFRFESLIDLYRNREDAIHQEISRLEEDRRRIERTIREAIDECGRIRVGLSSGEERDPASALRYIQGVLQRREMAKGRCKQVEEKIHERREALMDARQERMRYDKLKERHQEKIRQHLKRVEQKESDEFASRTWNRQDG